MTSIHPSSFRDPSGFIFQRKNTLYRQVNLSYRESYDKLLTSGLYDKLVKKELLVSHTEQDMEFEIPEGGYKVLQPQLVPFISYPYEWCFSQLKMAALATLEIQTIALEHGMSLKDCSAYNIQFIGHKPLFIDTLSFEEYKEGEPWVAYKQFCQHFLAPLALMRYGHISHGKISRLNIDGLPLDQAASILPFKTYFNFSMLVHIHFHAWLQSKGGAGNKKSNKVMKKNAVLGLIGNLNSSVKKMKLPNKKSVWAKYYSDTNYSEQAFDTKKQLVENFIEKCNPKSVWDLGANTGLFTRLASAKGIPAIAFDFDALAVEFNFQEVLKNKEQHILPLVADLTNPSPGIGWENTERMSMKERGPAGAIFALGLVHHLAIGNNLPLIRIAQFFAGICQYAIVEFIPKEDSQVKRLLSSREDIFSEYHQKGFEASFSHNFNIKAQEKIKGSERTLYLFENK